MRKTKLKAIIFLIVFLFGVVADAGLMAGKGFVRLSVSKVNADTQYYYDKYKSIYSETVDYSRGTFQSTITTSTTTNVAYKDFKNGKYLGSINGTIGDDVEKLDGNALSQFYIASGDNKQLAVYGIAAVYDTDKSIKISDTNIRVCALDSFFTGKLSTAFSAAKDIPLPKPIKTLYFCQRFIMSPYPTRGALVQQNILATNGTYPDNGVHTDGYWYVKRNTIAVNIISPVQNCVFTTAQSFSPRIFIPYSFRGSTLNCSYYLDSESIPRQTVSVANSLDGNTVQFSSVVNAAQLSGGSHTIRVMVTDGTSTAQSNNTFTIDNTPPTINSFTVSASTSSVTVTGSASDSLGMDAAPYQYTITNSASGTSYIQTWSSSSSFTQGQLAPNTLYTVKFEAKDVSGNISSSSKNIYTKAEVPQLTVGNSTTTTLDVAVIDSNPSSTQYQIMCGSSYVTQTGVLSASPCWITLTNKKITVTGLSLNTGYSFTAKARNGSSEETSMSLAASGRTKLGVPSGITANSTSNSITLNWTAVQGATAYDVTADGTVISNITGTTYTHSGLAANTSHTYKIMARSSTVTSDWSSQVSYTTKLTTPAIPTAGTITSGSIIINWTAIPGATAYDVLTDGVTVSNITGTTYTHSGLAANTAHTYKVMAKNAATASDWSSQATYTTRLSTPNTPALASAAADSITLNWVVIPGATAYDVMADGTVISNITGTTYTHSGLTANTSHTYKIMAKNTATTSDWSSQVTYMTVLSTPNAPDAVSTSDSITLSWTAVPGASAYDISADGTVVNSTGTSYTHSGLAINSNHIYKIRAKNAGGASDWSSATSKATKPATPSNGSIINITNTSIQAAWGSNGNQSDVQYKLAAFDSNNSIIKQNSWINAQRDTIVSLNPISNYNIRVKARNVYGEETDWYMIDNAATLPNPPGPPTNLSAAATNNKITLSWSAADGAESYDVEADDIVIATKMTVTSFEHTGLNAVTQHKYRVVARNAGGSTWSSVLTKTTLRNPPKPLENIAIEANSLDTIKLSWESAADANGYIIKADGVSTDLGTGTSYIHSSLPHGSTHSYTIIAYNESGSSMENKTVNASTMLDVPGDITATATNNKMVLSWKPVQGASYYTIEINGNPSQSTGTSYVVNSLQPDTTYSFRIKANNSLNEGAWSNLGTKLTLPDLPRTPSNIDIQVTATTIKIAWDAVNGATGYDIEADGVIKNAKEALYYEIQNLQPDTTHIYKVRARNAGGKSAWSTPLEARTQAVSPDIPFNLTAIPTEDSITLRWNPVDGAESYDVMVDDTSLQTVFEAVYEDNNLTSGTERTYSVRADISGNKSEWSAPITVFTLTDPITVPQNVYCTVEDTSVTVNWDAVEIATGYDIEVDGEVLDNGSSTVYEHKSLSPATHHYYRVRMRGEQGEGGWSNYVQATTLPPMPSAPEGITAVSTQNAIIVNWNPVKDAIGYIIEADGNIIEDIVDTTYIHQALQPDTEYRYRIRAVSDEGLSSWSSPITISTLSAKPEVPDNIKATASENAIILNWRNSAGAKGYELEIDNEQLETVEAAFYENTGLQPETVHTYRIRAVNSNGKSDWSEKLAQKTLPASLPAPGNIHCYTNDNSMITTWEAVYAAVSYDVEIDGELLRSVMDTSFTKSDLLPNTQHSFRVRANGLNGSGEWSGETTVITDINMPKTPENLKAEAGSDNIALSWEPVSEAQRYEIEADGAIIGNISDTAYLASGLTPQTQHSYRIRTVGNGGYSLWSDLITVFTAYSVPGVPDNLSTASASSTITVSWKTVDGALGYEIEADGKLVSDLTQAVYTHANLTPATIHVYRVRAVNENGYSEWSYEVHALTTIPPVEVPGGLNAIVSGTAMTVTWKDVAGAAGYEVEIDGAVKSTGTNTKYTIDGLLPDTQHTCRVRAVSPYCDYGQSQPLISNWSAAVTKTIQLEKPVITVKAEGTGITVSWNAVAGTQKYQVLIDDSIIDNGSSTVYMHKDLLPYENHKYSVRAVGNLSTSDWSSQVLCATSTWKASVGTKAGDVFDLLVSAKDMSNLGGKQFTLTYNPSELSLLDICDLNFGDDLIPGSVKDTNITVIKYDPVNGVVIFKADFTAESSKLYNGAVNVLKFKALIDGTANVYYTIQ